MERTFAVAHDTPVLGALQAFASAHLRLGHSRTLHTDSLSLQCGATALALPTINEFTAIGSMRLLTLVPANEQMAAGGLTATRSTWRTTAKLTHFFPRWPLCSAFALDTKLQVAKPVLRLLLTLYADRQLVKGLLVAGLNAV